MHPLCCVSERNSGPSFADVIDMATDGSESVNRGRGEDFSRATVLDPNPSNNACRSNSHGRSSGGGSGDHGLLAHRTGLLSPIESSSLRLPNESQLVLGENRDVKINEIVGNGISGVLYKWVNYGRGWRPRWFVLQDGVLSYYKIHGPDKIEVNKETEKGLKVIGEESFRRISRHKNGHSSQMRRKPVGEVHLKVSSIRESKSDDKRFSIFTGTKRLHLRAETRDDRAAWMEALQRVKELFPRISNSELMAPLDNFVVSTDKLRVRLLDEGVSERAIQDVEQIMKTEFSEFQNQLELLKQKQFLLIDTLRQLEVQGIIQDRSGKTAATLFGKWDESMYYVNGDCSGKGKGLETLSDARLLWKRSKPPKFPTRYNLTRFATTLNELAPGLKEKLPPTDSRLRPDQRCLENGEYEMANSEKLRLEQRQRQSRKMQERGWKPQWFAKEKLSDTYHYIGGYWEAREKGFWDSCPDIFGQVTTDQMLD